MNRADFSALRDRHYAMIAEINDRKGHDYAGDEDALANFKKDDDRLRQIVQNDPTLAKWYIYFDKHYEAVMTFLEEGDVKSEPIEGRIHDCILYLFLLLGLIEEDKKLSCNGQTGNADDAGPGGSLRVLTRLPNESDAEYARRLRSDDPESLRIQTRDRIEDNLQERSAAMAPRGDGNDGPF